MVIFCASPLECNSPKLVKTTIYRLYFHVPCKPDVYYHIEIAKIILNLHTDQGPQRYHYMTIVYDTHLYFKLNAFTRVV
jgi:hypothetical protein